MSSRRKLVGPDCRIHGSVRDLALLLLPHALHDTPEGEHKSTTYDLQCRPLSLVILPDHSIDRDSPDHITHSLAERLWVAIVVVYFPDRTCCVFDKWRERR